MFDIEDHHYALRTNALRGTSYETLSAFLQVYLAFSRMLGFYEKNETKPKRTGALDNFRQTGAAIAALLRSIQTGISTILTAVNFDANTDAFFISRT